MFEDEIQMEQKSSGIVPLLLILSLVAVVGGAIVYFAMQAREKLTPVQASTMVNELLAAQGPAKIHFHVGLVVASVDEKPQDPHYRLLEKAGLVKLGKPNAKGAVPVKLTDAGKSELAELNAQKEINKDGTEAYTVPLAARKLVEISKVTMYSPMRAQVDYTWKWEPNKLGEAFEASGAMLKSFNTWDRATLIKKYGADFYHGDATKAAVVLVKPDKTWRVATE